MLIVTVTIFGLFLVGLLAGEEFIVRFGIQPALRTLEDRAHILSRMALVRRLMIVVPSLMIPTVVMAVAVLILNGTGPGFVCRILGMTALVTFLILSFFGTVPINVKVNDTWSADNPPSDWKQLVKRWEFIDTFRATAAILAFVFFLIAVAQQRL